MLFESSVYTATASNLENLRITCGAIRSGERMGTTSRCPVNSFFDQGNWSLLTIRSWPADSVTSTPQKCILLCTYTCYSYTNMILNFVWYWWECISVFSVYIYVILKSRTTTTREVPRRKLSLFEDRCSNVVENGVGSRPKEQHSLPAWKQKFWAPRW